MQTRPNPTNTQITIPEAVERGFDTCQVKYDGFWTRNVVGGGWLSTYNPHGTLMRQMAVPTKACGVVVGNYYTPEGWGDRVELVNKTFVFDCLEVTHNNITYNFDNGAYKNRYIMAKYLATELGTDFVPVRNYPIAKAEWVWEEIVVKQQYKGLIFRRADEKPSFAFNYLPYYPDIPGDFRAVRQAIIDQR